ncbi:hypothetical protein HPB47_018772 [Ixodes persulcatus]|uniref:Uncharacterized protein n=1 Tax=Ixodes persulcatus TaxID=34615 RepID=A0AC60QKQ8_IXOPE|nr:hypothetical protein HPB47_018772 [Ixodes persulcatus]
MNCFLKPFVQEMNRLSSAGVAWTDANGSSRRTRVFPGPCFVDTVARCAMMSMTQFNGAYGLYYMHAVCSGFVKYTACMWFDYSQVEAIRKVQMAFGEDAMSSTQIKEVLSSFLSQSAGLNLQA